MILNYKRLLPLILLCASASINAETRWFEVELLLFERNAEINSTQESLIVKDAFADTSNSIPLLTAKIQGTCQ